MSWRPLVLAASTVVLALAGIATVTDAPAVRLPEPTASASEPERVRIEHAFVRIPVTNAPQFHALRAAASPKPDRDDAAAPRLASRRADASGVNGPDRRVKNDPSRLLSRTVQTIVGDGRYKPEPFPRPGG
jgi:hypothetical protein